MGYDVDRRPGEWVGARARREFVIVAMGSVAAVGLAIVGFFLSFSAALAAVVLLAVAGYLYRATLRRIDSYDNWEKGRLAEQAVGHELQQLRRDGFVLMHGIEPDGRGDVDHVVSGPTGVFLVETKFRRYETWQLGKVKRQAVQLHDELGVWVTPVICLATREYKPIKHRKVWVMGKNQLLDWIRAQNEPQAEFERLACYADGL